MPLTLERIMEAASGEKTYQRGMNYYKQGRVSELKISQNPSSQGIKIKTWVEGGEDDYDVLLRIEHDQVDGSCTCPAYSQYDGICKHMVAAAIAYVQQEAEKVWNVKQSVQGNERVRSDKLALRMLSQYTARETAEIVGQNLREDTLVELYPALLRGYGERYALGLSIGNKRKYIIKDIGKLVMDVQRSARVSYGKQLEFIHSIENFTAGSQALLRFVIDKYEESKAYRGNYYGGYTSSDRRSMILTPSALDQLFDMYLGKEMTMELGKEGQQPFVLVNANPAIEVQVTPQADGVEFQADNFGLANGEKYLYYAQDGKLYRCDMGFTHKARDFLSAMHQAGGRFFIARQDLPLFCSNVLPEIRQVLALSGGVRELEAFEPQTLETHLMLDAPERNYLTGAIAFCYGDEQFDPFQQNESMPVERRDMRAELRTKVVISRYFRYYDPKKKNLYLEGDDTAIYQFLEEGLPELMEIATVEVSDRFRKIGMVAPPKLSVGVSLESDLLELNIDTGEFPLEELMGILSAYRQNLKFYRLTDGRYMRMEDNTLTGFAQIADGLELDQKQLKEGKVKVPSYRALYLDKVLRDNEEIRFNRDKYFKNMVRSVRAVEDSDFIVPESLSGILRNYQKTGFRWLKTLETYRFGGILADDMGLGKTLQMIALLMSAHLEGDTMPSLVVSPASLVLNWESELHRFAPDLPVRVVIGDTAQRKELISMIEPGEVVVTSYDLLKRDIEQYENLHFHYEIIDEAQYIKNHTTQNARTVKAIDGRQRFALTGTPVENRLSELWSIFDYLMPGYLYHYNRFKQRFELPIVRDHDGMALEQLNKMVQPFVLRRLKRDVLAELPQKTETVVRAVLEGEQRKLYFANAAQIQEEVRKEMEAAGFERNKMVLLAMLTKLRQICCDPSLCYENYEGPSAKLEACLELVREAVDSGHKILLFSQFTSMLDILESRLRMEGISFCDLRGDTPKEKRAKLVEQFNHDDTSVFLISLKAGGTGLNLTGADVVIHYDPWWNVAAQNQATDRAHRIGQKNRVQVYKLIAQDSLEEKILHLQETKQELAESVIGTGEAGEIFSMSGEQLLELLEA